MQKHLNRSRCYLEGQAYVSQNNLILVGVGGLVSTTRGALLRKTCAGPLKPVHSSQFLK